MASKAVLAAAVALSLAAGLAGGGATQGLGLFARDPAPAGPAPVSHSVAPASTVPGAADPSGAGPALEGSPAALAARLAEERAQRERLAQQVADLTAQVAALKQAQPAPAAGPVFTFGTAGKLEAVRQADWGALAAAAQVVDRAVIEMYEHRLAGTPVPKETLLRLQENTERMRTYEYRTLDKLPTAAQHNGELTHPITITNLVAALLAQAGKPLSAGQVAEIERLGSVFDEDFARLRERWSERVPRARRMLEEYRRKGRLLDDLLAALTPEQRALVVDPRYRGVAGLDLLDPTLMVLHTSPLAAGADSAQIRAALSRGVAQAWGLAEAAQAGPVERLLDAFLARLAPGLEAVPQARARNYTYAQALAAGEATADLVDGLLQEGSVSAEARARLLDSPAWFIPRLVTP